MELAACEVQIHVLAKGHLAGPGLPVDVENVAHAQNLVRLGHEFGFTVIGNERREVKIRDPIARTLGERTYEGNAQAVW